MGRRLEKTLRALGELGYIISYWSTHPHLEWSRFTPRLRVVDGVVNPGLTTLQ
ncbi:MAG: hypothetical protein N3G79_03285 [Sulfolobales archaeon]|nr:hypothetical protein [Sulfolobales archaeon]